MKPSIAVDNGLPFINGKLVVLVSNPDIPSEDERVYLHVMFPYVVWDVKYDHITQGSFVYPRNTEWSTEFDDIISAYHKLFRANYFDESEVLVADELTVVCETDTRIMVVCEPGIADADDRTIWQLLYEQYEKDGFKSLDSSFVTVAMGLCQQYGDPTDLGAVVRELYEAYELIKEKHPSLDQIAGLMGGSKMNVMGTITGRIGGDK